jgi:hypothetical protein
VENADGRNPTPSLDDAMDSLEHTLSSSESLNQYRDFSGRGTTPVQEEHTHIDDTEPLVWDLHELSRQELDPFEPFPTEHMASDMQDAHNLIRVALHNTFDNREKYVTPLEAAGEVLKIMNEACEKPWENSQPTKLQIQTEQGLETIERHEYVPVNPQDRLPNGALNLFWATAFYEREERTQKENIARDCDELYKELVKKCEYLTFEEVRTIATQRSVNMLRQAMKELWDARQQILAKVLHRKMDEVNNMIKNGHSWVAATASLLATDTDTVMASERFAPLPRQR